MEDLSLFSVLRISSHCPTALSEMTPGILTMNRVFRRTPANQCDQQVIHLCDWEVTSTGTGGMITQYINLQSSSCFGSNLTKRTK